MSAKPTKRAKAPAGDTTGGNEKRRAETNHNVSTLTTKQKRFVDEYLIDLNATQAAIRAGYSATTAKVIACENLTKPNIAELIQKRMGDRIKRTEITQDRVLREYARIGFSDMRKFTEWGPSGVSLNDSAELNDDDAACVAEVSEVTSKDGGSIKFKLHDKKGALDSLARHLGMFVDKQEITLKRLNEYGDEELRQMLADLGSEDGLESANPGGTGPEIPAA